MKYVTRLIPGLALGLALSGSLLSTTPLSAIAPRNLAEIFAGVRQDKIVLNLSALNDASEPVTASYTNNKLRMWEGGVRLTWAPDCQWWIRATADYAKITSGNAIFNELPTLDTGLTVTGKETGQAYDGSIGFGYLFELTCNFGVSPSFSWVGHRQQIYTNDTFIGSTPTGYRKVTAMWGGPSLGLDLIYECNCWYFEAGYAAQLNYCRQRINAPSSSITDISAHTKYNYGSLVHLRAQWQMTRCLTLALQADYEFVSGSNSGTVWPDAVTDVYSNAAVTKTEWQSGTLSLSLGYLF